jgi:hypothetical protein
MGVLLTVQSVYCNLVNLGMLVVPEDNWAWNQAGPLVDVVPGPDWEATMPVVTSSTTAVAFDFVNLTVMVIVSPGAEVVVDELQSLK